MSWLGNGPGKLLVQVPPTAKSIDYTMLNDAATQSLAAYRNKIHNPYALVNQRGIANISTNGFVVDRWSLQVGGNYVGAVTAGWQALTMSDYGPNCLYLYNGGNALTPNAGAYLALSQIIEGFDIADLLWGTAAAKPVTISFKVRCSFTGFYKFTVAVRNNNGSRSYVKELMTGVGGTDTYCVVTIPGDTTGTWDTSSGPGIQLWFCAGVGTTYATSTPGQWLGGNFVGTPTQGNLCNGPGGNYLYFTDMKLEAGTFATPHVPLTRCLELEICRRYLRYFGNGVAGEPFGGMGYFVNATTAYVPMTFVPRMRATPTISAPAGSFQCTNAAGNYPVTNLSATGGTPESTVLITAVSGSPVANTPCMLNAANSSCVMILSAEI